MNSALSIYADSEDIICIHGYVYPCRDRLPETFFIRGADCWGWATWRRGWKSFNSDGKYLLDQIKGHKLEHKFNFDGAYDFIGMLGDQIAGKNDSWAIRWNASAFLANKLTLYPGRSLVDNIGNDGSGTHNGSTNMFDVSLALKPILIKDIPLLESKIGYRAFSRYFKSHNNFLLEFINRAKRALSKILP
jgi:hypothetical protein